MKLDLGRVLSHTAGGLAEDMQNNREYVRSTKDRLKADLFAQGQERRNAQKKARKSMEYAVDFLSNEGLENEKLLYLLSEDPKELMRLAKMAEERKLDGSLSAQALNAAVELAQNFQAPDMTPSELIKKATPDFVEGAEIPAAEDNRNMLQRLFQRPGMDVVAGDVYSSEILPGVSGADIAASMQADAYQSKEGQRSGNIDYSSLQPVDTRLIRDIQKDIVVDYNTALEDYTKALRNDNEGGKNQPKIEIAKEIEAMDNGKAKLQKMMELLGFDIAKDYYSNSPEVFNDQPSFISSDYVESYIAGDEEFTPSNNDTFEVTVDELTLSDGQDPIVEAKSWFGREGNQGKDMIQVNMPDGSKRMFRRSVDEDGRSTIQEVG